MFGVLGVDLSHYSQNGVSKSIVNTSGKRRASRHVTERPKAAMAE